jgi:hypothetical protein
MPPTALGDDSQSQERQCTFFLPSSTPHEWFAIADLILSQLVMGTWKQLITKVGIAWITAFKKVSFPTLDIGRSTTPFIRFQIIS